MSEVKDRNNFIQGYLIWSFLTGMFFIPISMAITTTDRIQEMTNWSNGYAMILGAIIGIILTLVVALPLEKRSR